MKKIILALSFFPVIGFSQTSKISFVNSYEALSARTMTGAEIRNGTDGNTRVELSSEKIQISKATQLKLKVSHVDGTLPKVVPTSDYDIHFIAIKDRDDQGVVHLHPTKSSEKNTWILTSQFPSSGEYQVWVQFQDDKDLRNISLHIKVYR